MRNRRLFTSLIGVALVIVIALSVSYVVGKAPETAPVPPDRQGTEKSLPAGPAQPDALPGKK